MNFKFFEHFDGNFKKVCINWHILDGVYKQFTYFYDIIQSKGNKQNVAMVAVIDGGKYYNCLLYRNALKRLHSGLSIFCLLYTSPSPRDKRQSRMPSSA